jgi:uncharacterized protein involved in exopolysaccharide biosynthesis
LHRPSGQFHFFDQETDQYRGKLQGSVAELVALNNKGVVSAALERDIALQKMRDADAVYRQVFVTISETGQRIQALHRALASLPERTTTQTRNLDNAQLLEQLKSTLLTLQLKRTELLTRFQPNYRLVEEVDQKIAETKAALAAEQRAPLREETTDKNPAFDWAKLELEKAQVELQGLRARQTASRNLLQNYRVLTRRLGEDSIIQQDLLRNAKAAEENYLLYLRKREQARIGDALDASGILNVTIVEPAKAPAIPRRSAFAFVFIGFLVATTLSTGLAFAADYLDPAFRTPQEVTAVLDVPVLAFLPRHAGNDRQVPQGHN